MKKFRSFGRLRNKLWRQKPRTNLSQCLHSRRHWSERSHQSNPIGIIYPCRLTVYNPCIIFVAIRHFVTFTRSSSNEILIYPSAFTFVFEFVVRCGLFPPIFLLNNPLSNQRRANMINTAVRYTCELRIRELRDGGFWNFRSSRTCVWQQVEQ